MFCSDQGEDYIKIPLFAGIYGGAVGTKYDWNLSYVPQPELNSRAVPIPQGKVVGGGSILNKMIFNRGSIPDYERWAELGAKNWDWSSLFPYFRKVCLIHPLRSDD
jgi:choline dehydrogenase-like flavoprotein